jgi:integrase
MLSNKSMGWCCVMTRVELPYVNAQRDRDGRPKYWYFRRNGRRWRLPGEPFSAAFMAEYQRLLAVTGPTMSAPAGESPPGSFGAVVIDYLASPEFKAKKPTTQRLYRMVLERLTGMHGNKPIALLERRHIKAWRNERSETPGMANMLVKVLQVLLNHAVDNELRPDNPAHHVKLFMLGEHRAWTDEECAAFEARWPAGSMQRRAYMLAKFTGQRRGDIAKMTRAHRKDGAIRVVQEKTGAELWITEHRDLADELALGGGHMSLLTRQDGGAFESTSLGLWFAEAIDEAGLPDACVMHGLRKTAARMLAEAGCSVHQIASVTGHQSLKEIERYTKGADQKRLATAAIHRLEQNRNRTRSGKRTPKKVANTTQDA